MPVLSIDDYKNYFANKCKPTLLVYKCKWDIKCERHFNKEQIPWSVIENVYGCHAEELLVDSLREKLKEYQLSRFENVPNKEDTIKENLHKEKDGVSGSFSLDIYLSWSPCRECADLLIAFKEEFSNQLEVEINISFSNLYKLQVTRFTDSQQAADNREGLKKLHKLLTVDMAGCFSILNGLENWKKFFQEMEVEGETTLAEWLEIVTTKQRKQQEVIDTKIFEGLEQSSDEEPDNNQSSDDEITKRMESLGTKPKQATKEGKPSKQTKQPKPTSADGNKRSPRAQITCTQAGKTDDHQESLGRARRVGSPECSSCEGTTTTSATDSHTEEYPQSLPRGGEDERLTRTDTQMTTRLVQRTLTGEVAVVKCGKCDKICKNLKGLRIHQAKTDCGKFPSVDLP